MHISKLTEYRLTYNELTRHEYMLHDDTCTQVDFVFLLYSIVSTNSPIFYSATPPLLYCRATHDITPPDRRPNR